MVKPKKALKGLFSRTEPADEAPEVQHNEVAVPAIEAAAPAVEPELPKPTNQVAHAQTFAPAAETIEPAPLAEVLLTAHAATSKKTAPPPVLQTLEQPVDQPPEQPLAQEMVLELAQPEAQPSMDLLELSKLEAAAPIAEEMKPIEESFAETPAPVVAPAHIPAPELQVMPKALAVQEEVQQVQPKAHPETVANDALLKIQYNFDRLRDERSKWHQGEYLAFIRRLDSAQTEAFLLKGKLLDEVKRRFFEDSKTGWKGFCEDSLRMNYTTANQYIRVAQEFDVTSHHRPDFGFEHFKALLPLAAPQRSEILEALPEVSVKTLRRIVQEKLQLPAPRASDSKNDAKSIVKILQNLKMQIFDCSIDSLNQTQRWQLSAACHNLSNELAGLAETLNKPVRRMGAAGHQNDVTSHPSSSASHQGSATMNDKSEDNF